MQSVGELVADQIAGASELPAYAADLAPDRFNDDTYTLVAMAKSAQL
jgi:hypothetical protein